MMRPSSTVFVDAATAYLAERRALGFALTTTGRRLLAFARHADEHHANGPLTIAMAVDWARKGTCPSPVTWARRLEIVRPFARYLRRTEPTTEVPPTTLLGRAHRRLAPHVYTPSQLQALVDEARELAPIDGLRPDAMVTLLGLLICTGLRASEALRLQRTDVDLGAGLLHIRLTKFRKARLVPLSSSAVDALRGYAARRDRRAPTPPTMAFFVVGGARPLTYSKVRTAFDRIRIRLGWTGRHRPRLHDLRHTFACRRLLQWHREGVDVDTRLVDLSVYLGHARVTDTYWYLSGFPELLALVGERFARFAAHGVGGRP
jgi:integrase